ncbi:MAG TPA: amidohydrolase family protein [Terriglobia bacterium]|nr:amidohydrolase family protein [Terriglobia bacterium]
MNRRAFLGLAAGAAALAAMEKTMQIIDTHIHLFDPNRPQGVPWPTKDDGILYQPTLPDRYRKVTQGFGISGAIAIECSPWVEDNDWLLETAARDTIIVGVVGNLEPGTADFHTRLDQLSRNPLFRGIRYGNLWGRDLNAQVAKPEFISGLKTLADAGLSLDTANPDPALVGAVVRITDRVPNLRVVIDHLPQLDPPPDPRSLDALRSNLRELGAKPQVYVKISEVLRRVDGRVPTDLGFYRARLDEIWQTFGENRLMFGSDWPNSDRWGTYPEVFRIAHDYVASKGASVEEKFFSKNSIAAYKWRGHGATSSG